MTLDKARLWPFGLILAAFISDQVTKAMVLGEPRFNARECLDMPGLCGQIPLPGPLDLTMLWNRGMSYGLFQSEGIMRWVLAAVMAGIAAGFFVWLLKAEGWRLKMALALVVGGAIGNLVDRVRFGAVVDFIDASDLMFPYVFNIADAAISVGAVLLFADQFLFSEVKKTRPAAPDDLHS
jgi:signal peptidase II